MKWVSIFAGATRRPFSAPRRTANRWFPVIDHAPIAQSGGIELALADHPDRIAAVPICGSRLHALEEAALGAADIGNLDHRTGMGRRLEIGKASLGAADLAFMADLEAGGDRAVVKRLVVGAPVRHMLHPLA